MEGWEGGGGGGAEGEGVGGIGLKGDEVEERADGRGYCEEGSEAGGEGCGFGVG